MIKIKHLVIAAITIAASHIATAQNKTGYTSLFNGKTLAGWKTVGSTASFKAEQGVIKGTLTMHDAGSYLITQKKYSDFVLELDVKTEGMVNSGIQVRSFIKAGTDSVMGKQCEIDPSDRKWTGGIFDNNRRGWLYPADNNEKAKSAYKTGEYNHLKIECIGNETRTWVNGIAVADVIDTLDNNGFIGLQIHGWGKTDNISRSAFFKNIIIKTTNLKQAPFPKDIYVANLQPNKLSPYEIDNGWKLLFDGVSSKGWHSAGKTTFPTKGWAINNGLISVAPPGGGDILTDDQYKAFDLSFQFKITPAANSGVKYFVMYNDPKNGPLGLEFQVLDDSLNEDAKLGRNGDRTVSSLYDLIPAKKTALSLRSVGQWNTGRVIVYPNNHVEHYLNGVKVLEYDRGSQAFKEAIAISKYKNFKDFGQVPQGNILLQDHGCVVHYKSIKLKEL